jgi:hypothetical protein
LAASASPGACCRGSTTRLGTKKSGKNFVSKFAPGVKTSTNARAVAGEILSSVNSDVKSISMPAEATNKKWKCARKKIYPKCAPVRIHVHGFT